MQAITSLHLRAWRRRCTRFSRFLHFFMLDIVAHHQGAIRHLAPSVDQHAPCSRRRRPAFTPPQHHAHARLPRGFRRATTPLSLFTNNAQRHINAATQMQMKFGPPLSKADMLHMLAHQKVPKAADFSLSQSNFSASFRHGICTAHHGSGAGSWLSYFARS